MKLFFTAVLFWGAFSAKATEIPTFTYRVQVPNEVNCAADAKNMAQMLADVFKTTSPTVPVTAICAGSAKVENNIENIIVISYQAEMEQVPYRANLGGYDGIFATYQKCTGAIREQKDSFGSATKLIPFAAYCVLSDSSINPGYALVVEGFGRPAARLYFIKGDHGPNEMSFVTSLVAAQNANIVYSSADYLFYYAKNPLNLQRQSFGSFGIKMSECQDQVNIAEQILIGLKSTNVHADCISQLIYEKTSFISLVAYGFDGQWVNEAYLQNQISYPNYESCKSDKSRVEKNLQRPVLGSICRPNDMDPKVYKLSVFY